jgi:NAD(P)-dependent dehydrogenase (short-subunit alcohol dehydrogenase family)
MSGLFDISGRVAVVVGGTSGLGREIALGFADAGAHTVATGRREDRVLDLSHEIRARGVETICQAADVSTRESIDALRDAVLARFGRVDILVNAAGRTFREPTGKMSETAWNMVMDTNLTGALRACQSFHDALRDSGHGRIVNVASLSSFTAFHQVAAYGASKSGLLALTRSLGCEWAKEGIRTNAVCPGVFVTDLNRSVLEGTARGREMIARCPLGRFGELNEVVGATLFLASDAASFITGTYIVVDGGILASGVNQ